LIEATARPAFRLRVALVVLTLAAYAPALTSPFQFDDRGSILRDDAVHGLGAALGAARVSLRPLLSLSYGLCWTLGGGSPAVFHAFNLLVHLVNVELVLRLAAAMARARGEVTPERLTPLGVAAAVLFALHPLQTEAVTYVTGRSASLATCFMLVALLCHAAGVRSARRFLTLVAAPAAFLAALASKETSAMFLLVLGAWELCVERPSVRVLLRRLGPWFAVTLLAVYALVMHPRTYALLYAALGRRSLEESVRYGLGGVAYLLARLSLLARPCIDPGLWVAPPSDGVVVVSAAALAAVLLVALRHRRGHPEALFGVVVFVLQGFVLHVLVPRVDVVNERQAYFANVGAFFAVGSLLAPFAARRRALRWVPLALGASLVPLALTYRRNLEYRTEVSLWEATVRDAPQNPRAENNLGVAYELAGRLAEARIAYTRALILEPRYAAARTNLARITPASRSRNPD
jgi:tetratricopeptide (TPR) repeat protein